MFIDANLFVRLHIAFNDQLIIGTEGIVVIIIIFVNIIIPFKNASFHFQPKYNGLYNEIDAFGPVGKVSQILQKGVDRWDITNK
jgi:hypothetical protein